MKNQKTEKKDTQTRDETGRIHEAPLGDEESFRFRAEVKAVSHTSQKPLAQFERNLNKRASGKALGPQRGPAPEAKSHSINTAFSHG